MLKLDKILSQLTGKGKRSVLFLLNTNSCNFHSAFESKEKLFSIARHKPFLERGEYIGEDSLNLQSSQGQIKSELDSFGQFLSKYNLTDPQTQGELETEEKLHSLEEANNSELLDEIFRGSDSHEKMPIEEPYIEVKDHKLIELEKKLEENTLFFVEDNDPELIKQSASEIEKQGLWEMLRIDKCEMKNPYPASNEFQRKASEVQMQEHCELNKFWKQAESTLQQTAEVIQKTKS
jgi:hypothetical protein